MKKDLTIDKKYEDETLITQILKALNGIQYG